MKQKSIYTIIVPILILLVWFISSKLNLVSSLFLPSPQAVLFEFFRLIATTQQNILTDLLITIARVFAAFFAACVFGIPIGLIMGYYGKVYDALEFVVEFFRAIPPTALFPLFLLFFGIGNLAKISMAFWGAFLIVVVNSMYGIKNANKLRIKAAVIMKASRISLFTKVILPEAMPQIAAGMRTSLSLTLILIIVVEMFIGTAYGLGHRIINAQLVYETAEMYVAIIMAGILGYVLNGIFIILERRFVHWSGK